MIRSVLTAALLAAILLPAGCGADREPKTPAPEPAPVATGGEEPFPEGPAEPVIRPRPGPGAEDLPIAEEREGDGWRFVLYRTNPGTRSEGTLGRLWKDGEEIRGTPGDALETPLGEFGFVEGVNLWDARGWLPAIGKDAGGTPPRLPK